MAGSNVLVVGGGPVGLTTALGLARAGVDVTLVERDDAIGVAPRAVIHHFFTLPGFTHLGVLDDMLGRGLLLDGIRFVLWETLESHLLRPELGDVEYPANLSLGQDELSLVLMEHLRRLSNVEIVTGSRLVGLEQDSAGVRARFATGHGEQVREAGWLVGADGANSATRKLLGLGFDGMTWSDRFVATNIRVAPPEPWSDANFSVDANYGAVFLRIGKTGLWRCTYKESGQLPVESYAERIPMFLGEFLRGTPFEVVAHSPYRMHQRSAQTYRVQRVLLAGDAAHVTNPTLAQGLTAGLHDAFALSHTLAEVVTGRADDTLLDEYAAARRAAFFEVLSPIATAYKQIIFDGGASPAAQQRNLDAVRAAAADPALQRANMLGLSASATPWLTGYGARRHEEVGA